MYDLEQSIKTSQQIPGYTRFESQIIACLEEGSRAACESFTSGEITLDQLKDANILLTQISHNAEQLLILLQREPARPALKPTAEQGGFIDDC
jgi:hypothetical protein